ncbi:MAG: hypothetical protein J5I98_00270 [Phaeodactylibacter sp.]|nr:hypothetical protein [Phaeodactylibacter sp.]
MAKKLTKKQLENHLQHLDKKELIAEVSKLFSRIEQVREYYQMEFGGKADREAVLADYKKQIRSQFYSSRSAYPQNPKASELRKIINAFKKVAVVSYDVVDLILYRVECAVEFTNDFGDIDDSFYTSAENAYRDALQLIEKEKLHSYFYDRCRQIVDDTWNIGWGFNDVLSGIFYEYFPDG